MPSPIGFRQTLLDKAKALAKPIANVSEYRMNICQRCPYMQIQQRLGETIPVCQKCGCDLRFKTLLSGFHCPDVPSRW